MDVKKLHQTIMKASTFILILSLIHILSFSQTSIEMEKAGGVYSMPCEVNGLLLKFIIDTGASEVSISLSEALFMLKNGYLNELDLKGSTFFQIANGNVIEGTTINIRTLRIGNREIYNVDAAIVHSLSAPLLLGQSALRKIGRFSIDYTNNSFILESNYLNSISENIKFNTYINYSRSYKIEYPYNWLKGSVPANNDGLHFWSEDNNIDLLVFSSVLHSNTFSEDYSSALLDPDINITYKLFRGKWYIISGFDKYSKKIVYKKVYWSEENDEKRTMILQYSVDKKRFMDNVIKYMVKSFIDI